jgi:hypothetical protein
MLKAETLRTLTDVTSTARFLAVARLRRQPGTSAKLWISQIFTRKALLEDPKLGTPIALPESLYLEILVGQMCVGPRNDRVRQLPSDRRRPARKRLDGQKSLHIRQAKEIYRCLLYLTHLISGV